MYAAFDLSGHDALVTGGNGGITVYLASPASSLHTGDEILIDGGYASF